MAGHPLNEEPFPNVQPELPLTQLYSSSSCPVAGHQREISTSSPLPPMSKLLAAMWSPLSFLFSKLNKRSELSCSSCFAECFQIKGQFDYLGKKLYACYPVTVWLLVVALLSHFTRRSFYGLSTNNGL